MIRKAVISDGKHIHRILNHYGGRGLLLARPLGEIYDHLRDFYVAEEVGETPPIVGVCALGICWDDLAEIRSLAVLEDRQHGGMGSRLVEQCIREARSFGLPRVFALTYVEGFFSRMGFREIEKAALPHKVWADCLKCPKFPDCDEMAMIMDL
ncbi:MAG: N-acetyltransferase [Deltaproteobacteria bacterium]|nr:N-acetyltransferase [Deltaproteobacteria bacterium]